MQLLAFPIFAQTYTQTIHGTVIDADSKSPLPGVNIVVTNTDTAIGTVTDVNGHYRLEKVPVGRRTIKATFLGYNDVVINNVIVTSGKEVDLPIQMIQKVYSSDAVTIVAKVNKAKANNAMVTNSAHNFQSEETERYAGSRADPSRMVANYAGVATGNDANNSIIVRGNSPLGVLWRLEGVDIPNPNHFSTQGATGGPISMLNNNVLASSDFLTGAFPAEYGNKIAAVFDLKMRNGNNEKNEYTAQLGLNGVEAGLEGPISKKNGSSYLVDYRYSTLDLFQLLGIRFGVSGIPRYQDLSYKIHIPTSKKGIFTFWGVGGLSSISLLDSKKSASDWSFTSKGEDLVFGSGMGATGFSHLYFFNTNTSGKLTLSVSASQNNITIDTLAVNTPPFRTYTDKSTDGQYIADYVLRKKINTHHLIKMGVDYKNLFVNYHSSFFSDQYHQTQDLLNSQDNTGLFQAYTEWQYRLNDKIVFNDGLHYELFTLNNSYAIEPRAGVNWQLKDNEALNFAYGLHSQTQPTIYYFYKTYVPATGQYVVTNRDLGLTKSEHFILGYDLTLSHHFHFKVETYYQYLFDVPVQKFPSSFSMLNEGNRLEGLSFVDSLANKGTGDNYGIEFTFEHFFSHHFYFLTDLSLYQSKYKGSDGVERYSAFSGDYVFNTIGGVELPVGKENNTISLDGKVTFAGGNRYTPIDLAASNMEHKAVYINDQAFSRKYKDYSKVDLKLSFKINNKKATQSFFVDVENILNTKNVLDQIYDPDSGVLKTEYQLGLFPYGGYRIEF